MNCTGFCSKGLLEVVELRLVRRGADLFEAFPLTKVPIHLAPCAATNSKARFLSRGFKV